MKIKKYLNEGVITRNLVHKPTKYELDMAKKGLIRFVYPDGRKTNVFPEGYSIINNSGKQVEEKDTDYNYGYTLPELVVERPAYTLHEKEVAEYARNNPNTSTVEGIDLSKWEDLRGLFGNIRDVLNVTDSRNDTNQPWYKRLTDKALWELDSHNPSGGLEGVFRNPAVQGALLSTGGLKLLPFIPSILANNITTPFTGKSLGDYLGDAIPILTSDAGNLITTSALYPAIQYKGRVALYNLKAPLGYSDNTSSKSRVGLKDNKQELTNVLLDFINPLSIKPKNNPYWLKVLKSQENSNKPFIGNIPAGAIGEFRNMIYRKALSFKTPKNNVFIKNPDGTYTVDIDKVNDIKQMYGGRKYHPHMNMLTEPVLGLALGKSPVYTKDFTTLEDVVGVGGQAWGHYIENANTGKSTGIILDIWDVQPFNDGRTIWKWGTKNIPGLKDLEVIDFLGGTPPTLKITLDNPNLFLRYF